MFLNKEKDSQGDCGEPCRRVMKANLNRGLLPVLRADPLLPRPSVGVFRGELPVPGGACAGMRAGAGIAAALKRASDKHAQE